MLNLNDACMDLDNAHSVLKQIGSSGFIHYAEIIDEGNKQTLSLKTIFKICTDLTIVVLGTSAAKVL